MQRVNNGSDTSPCWLFPLGLMVSPFWPGGKGHVLKGPCQNQAFFAILFELWFPTTKLSPNLPPPKPQTFPTPTPTPTIAPIASDKFCAKVSKWFKPKASATTAATRSTKRLPQWWVTSAESRPQSVSRKSRLDVNHLISSQWVWW